MSKNLRVFVLIALGELALTAGGRLYSPDLYSTFLGTINPLLLVLVVSTVAAPLYAIFDNRFLAGVEPRPAKLRVFIAPLAGACFGLLFIPVDIHFRLPADLNVLFPTALLYYPVLGYVVDVLFHLVPFVVLKRVLEIVLPSARNELRALLALGPCLLTEPIFQVSLISSEYSVLFKAILFFFLMAYSACQLFLLLKHGFHHMLAFRYGHYLVWHMIWGFIRLRLLF